MSDSEESDGPELLPDSRREGVVSSSALNSTKDARPANDNEYDGSGGEAEMWEAGALYQGDDDDGFSLVQATSSVMPSLSGQARLSRASHRGTSPVFSHSSRGTLDDDSVLITELKGADAESHTANEWRMRRSIKKKKIQTVHISSDGEQEYETDLEIEDDGSDDLDLNGRATYQKVCDELGIVPASYFIRHLDCAEVSMKYHGLGSSGARAIAAVLKRNITLERVDLSGNWIEPEGGVVLAKTLQENDYITTLQLADNKLGRSGAYHFCKMLLVNTTLRTLDLSGNGFGDIEAAYLAEAIEENKYLKELILSNNQFGETAGAVLGPSIGANDVLDVIDLSWNQIRGHGAVAVAKGLKENVRLKSCDLSWNGFGVEGGKAIADALATNDSLLDLNVTGNRLDIDGAHVIAKALANNETLRTLKIGSNPISTAGAVALASAVNNNENCVLTRLDLKDVPVEFEYLKLVDEIQAKKTFHSNEGTILRSGNTTKDLGKMGVDPNRISEPLLLLNQHILVKDARILDILQSQDEEKTMSVTMSQFVDAIQQLGVPYTREQLEEVAEKLDKNGDGKVHYGELMKHLEKESGNQGKLGGAPENLKQRLSHDVLQARQKIEMAPEMQREIGANSRSETVSSAAGGKLGYSKKEGAD